MFVSHFSVPLLLPLPDSSLNKCVISEDLKIEIVGQILQRQNAHP